MIVSRARGPALDDGPDDAAEEVAAGPDAAPAV
jgi:hypothetical protein